MIYSTNPCVPRREVFQLHFLSILFDLSLQQHFLALMIFNALEISNCSFQKKTTHFTRKTMTFPCVKFVSIHTKTMFIKCTITPRPFVLRVDVTIIRDTQSN